MAPLSGVSAPDGAPPPPPPLSTPPATPPPPRYPPPTSPEAPPAGRPPPELSASSSRDAAGQVPRRRCVVIPPSPSRFDLQNRLLSELHDCIVPNLLTPSASPAPVWVTPPSLHPHFNSFFVKNSLCHCLAPRPSHLSVVRVQVAVFVVTFRVKGSRMLWWSPVRFSSPTFGSSSTHPWRRPCLRCPGYPRSCQRPAAAFEFLPPHLLSPVRAHQTESLRQYSPLLPPLTNPAGLCARKSFACRAHASTLVARYGGSVGTSCRARGDSLARLYAARSQCAAPAHLPRSRAFSSRAKTLACLYSHFTEPCQGLLPLPCNGPPSCRLP